ncbi:MAG: hypothetical protein SFU86_03665 [Pirellulaceae bacterium]|nr:hypothetical protein [Pirellulaceae bacterium]
MPHQDLFVGSVAVILGLSLLAGAVFDGRWLMQLAKPQWLAGSLGKGRARVAIGLVGAALIGIGVSIWSGWRVNWG